MLKISSSSMLVRKLAEDCCKYGAENQSTDSFVARAALSFGTSHDLMENERETMLGILGDQVKFSLLLYNIVIRDQKMQQPSS